MRVNRGSPYGEMYADGLHFAVRKKRWSISFGRALRLLSLSLFTDPERYYIELSIEVLVMNLAEG